MSGISRFRKVIFCAAVSLFALSLAPPASASPFDGEWTIIPDGGSWAGFSVKTDGNSFTGTTTDIRGNEGPIHGRIRNGKIEWNESGGGMVVVYTGTIQGDKMRISVYFSGKGGPRIVFAQQFAQGHAPAED